MMSQKKIKVGIVGITGYGGGELARILLSHPHFELCYGSSGKDEGKSLSEVHPNLRGLTDLVLSGHPTADAIGPLADLEAVFLAMPHGKSMCLLPFLPKTLKVVDLAGDYRLKNLDQFKEFYGCEHTDFERTSEFVYGLTEISRGSVRTATYVANPGCFATAVQLALYPFAKAAVIQPRIIVDAKTGSSGSGASPRETTHHPFRDGSFYAYKLLSHQHLPEINQTLEGVGFKSELMFQVHSAPMVRGIFASCYLELKQVLSTSTIQSILNETYGESPFIRLVEGSPNVHWLRQSNFADIGFGLAGKNLVVFCAIDNLVKGAAGQAVQNMNLMWGLRETSGLYFAGGFPG